MDFDQLYPNRFLKAGEFQGKDVTLVVASVKLEELGEGKEKKAKAILTFERTPKQMVLNRTNGECIKAMFGRNTDDWIGKPVTFFPATIDDPFTGEKTLAIRVRGSPAIDGPRQVAAKIGRKTVTLKVAKTGKANGKPAQKQAQPPPPPPPPEPQAEDSEMPPDFEEPPPFDPVTGEVLA
jgi:hypothetical protein